MSRFDKHFHLSTQDVIEYVREKEIYFNPSADLVCTEIGDGNINYVFRVEDKNSDESIIVKHADITSRVSHRVMSPTHNRIEALALAYEGKIAPNYVPGLYRYDSVMSCIVMEDLKGFENVRNRLVSHKISEGLAESTADFLAIILMRSTDNIILPEKKREMVKEFSNPELCEITERLVYTDPYTDFHKKNRLFEPNKDFCIQELYRDEELHYEVAKLKDDFKNKSQSLVHGDMHTGSILTDGKIFKYLDPEFSTYAPAGFDIGTFMANLMLAWANAYVSMQDNYVKTVYIGWLEETIEKTIDIFFSKALRILLEETTDTMAKQYNFLHDYLIQILEDAAGHCGVEMIRRIVGSAKAKDIEEISNPEQRVIVERTCIYAAKYCIMNRTGQFHVGKEYLNVLHEAAKKATA